MSFSGFAKYVQLEPPVTQFEAISFCPPPGSTLLSGSCGKEEGPPELPLLQAEPPSSLSLSHPIPVLTQERLPRLLGQVNPNQFTLCPSLLMAQSRGTDTCSSQSLAELGPGQVTLAGDSLGDIYHR